MIRLMQALRSWGAPDFAAVLKRELEQLGADQLPLQQGLSGSSYALDNGINVMILGTSEDEGFVHVHAGIFYSGVIAGCNCADDPSPVDESTEYCEVRLAIDKNDARTRVTLC